MSPFKIAIYYFLTYFTTNHGCHCSHLQLQSTYFTFQVKYLFLSFKIDFVLRPAIRVAKLPFSKTIEKSKSTNVIQKLYWCALVCNANTCLRNICLSLGVIFIIKIVGSFTVGCWNHFKMSVLRNIILKII
jgi:hypothetical protein